ncbi:MAG: hemerythrin domain-containing protein, partial [Bacillota bacterium]|nr:hemerythrin domain-containing protein [Bacillota bacterium]
KIKEFLTELEAINLKIQKLESYNEKPELFIKLEALANNIMDAEKHHKREEDVLFPELEKRNITGPTRIMRMEHDDLRKRKKLLKETAHVAVIMDFDECKKRIDELAKYIVFNLRDHIYKENYILYPTAIDALKDKDLWAEMKTKSDEIGYCPFTPGK